MKKVAEIIGIILLLFALYLCSQGWKYTFNKEKVYIKYGVDTIHSTPYCPKLCDDEMAIDYMQETGNLVGSEEFPRSESLSDMSLDMCPYCFSSYEINRRNEYYRNGYKESYEEKVREAKRLRREKEMEKLKKK